MMKTRIRKPLPKNATAMHKLEKTADYTLDLFGTRIGIDAMRFAVAKFQPTENSFNTLDILTDDAASELFRLMGKFWQCKLAFAMSELNLMNRKELNAVRAIEGLPPV